MTTLIVPRTVPDLLKQAEFDGSVHLQGWLIGQIAWRAATDPTYGNRRMLKKIIDRDERN